MQSDTSCINHTLLLVNVNNSFEKVREVRWFRGRVVCALDYEAGDPGSIPGSGGTTDWLFSAGW